MIVFKNMESQWVERFWSRGEVCLRPFRYFASIDGPRADKLEGSRGIQIESRERIETTSERFFTAKNISIRRVGGGSVPITIESGPKIRSHEKLPDGYLFCVSEIRVGKFVIGL
jgi:hypothetical protein